MECSALRGFQSWCDSQLVFYVTAAVGVITSSSVISPLVPYVCVVWSGPVLQCWLLVSLSTIIMNTGNKHTATQSILYDFNSTISRCLFGILHSLKNVVKFQFKSHKFSVSEHPT